MSDKKTMDIHFVARDAVDNIARIKDASWKVLAVEAATFTFIVVGRDELRGIGFVHLGFYLFSMFLAYVACWEYPAKLTKYRKRLGRALKKI